MPEPLATGITALDRNLDGGLPPGSLVALTASPSSQSEQVIRDLADARKTLVVTTRRPRSALERSLDRRGLHPEKVAVRAVDPGAPDQILPLVGALEDRSFFVLDPVNPVEHLAEQEYVNFLGDLQYAVRETDSVALLHSLNGDDVPTNREVTSYMADVVFELTTQITGGKIEHRLAVPKARDGHPFKEVMKLELGNEVAVDTSRDIG